MKLGSYNSDVNTVNSYVNISAIKLENGGLYTCKAVNPIASNEHSSTIKVASSRSRKEENSDLVLSANVTTSAGKTVFLPCTVEDLGDGKTVSYEFILHGNSSR